MTITAVSSGSIPKFGIYGTPVTHAGLMIAEAPPGTIILGPTSRSLLPGMYKVKDFKEVAGVGQAHQLLDREGRTPVKDKDIHALQPVKKTEAGGDAKKEAAGAGGGGGDSAAPAAASAESGGGGGGGGDDSPATNDGGGGGASEESGGGGGSDEAPAVGEDGEVKARPVSVANTTQCCGGLKSGVCSII